MGRPAKPLKLHLYEGNTNHLTKAEIEQRKAAEISLGSEQLKITPAVSADVAASKKWRELVRLYQGTGLVTTSDTGILEQYCLLYSEISKLRDNLCRAELEYNAGLITLKDYLSVHKALDAKRVNIRSLEDRLFLNPLAKIRNVPKPQPKEREQTPLEKAGFGGL